MSKKNKAISEYYIVYDVVRIALLRKPILEDMFWVSFEIVPLTESYDSLIYDDDFWIYGRWGIFEAITNRPIPNVIASSIGIDRQKGRITLRGIH
jgi:hypothetical protein